MAPAVSICVASSRPHGWQFHQGGAGWVDVESRVPVSAGTPFDLASVTKPFVALTAAQVACCSGLRLSWPVARYLPELRESPVGGVSLEQLMSHRSGLRAHSVLFSDNLRKNNANRSSMLARAARAVFGPFAFDDVGRGTLPALYSDLGYLLLGASLERAIGLPLDMIVRRFLGRPLCLSIGSSRQWHEDQPDFRQIVAPSEYVAWRGGMIRGQVHDENAWAWAGHGLAGHAGLFGTASSVALLGCAVLDSLASRNSPLQSFAAHCCTAPRAGGTLRAGFDGKSGDCSTAGRLMSPCAFGHLGFTGTSLWCDPTLGISIALLTNRVCPSRTNTRLVASRKTIQEALTKHALNANLGAQV